MADIVQHPSSLTTAERPPEAEDDRTWPGDLDLALETRALIMMLKREIGLNWVTFEVRLQIEKCERLLCDPYGLGT